ncbi:post-GPI attachment to proteins factor 2-like [Diorhabda sublineata]|uniref:post-GPI attachment to proteins factor 2-like n=1 Tax=Diorhabda sublineata TaxID=1163346 RepID=UPI0024E0AE5D|nr:post-GPI attachment to proteins factor 2-like [Diorhabda sublineata]
MTSELEPRKEERFLVHYRLSFKQVCLVTVSFPFLALIICFISAYIFQYDDIHETHCRVFNIVPSISAITGISPQRYIWRISIAFHVGPRLIISAVYRAYHLTLINPLAQNEVQLKAQFWLNMAFWTNVIETGALCGVTYISNRENYAIHEKFFIIFMVSSLVHMLACIKGIKAVGVTRNKTDDDLTKCLQLKQNLLNISLLMTVGLIGFFLEHRLLCHRMAFSMFALCEYIIAFANMAFHVTIIMDFPTEHFMVATKLNNQQEDAKSL